MGSVLLENMLHLGALHPLAASDLMSANSVFAAVCIVSIALIAVWPPRRRRFGKRRV